jgi:hypothetical protein
MDLIEAINNLKEVVMERLPKKIVTQRSSQIATPASRDLQSSSSHLPLVEELEDTAWPVYEPKNLDKDYYFDLLVPHFEAVNGTNRYRLVKSRNHFWVKDEGAKKTLLRCGRLNHNGRNLYLELFACDYCVTNWINARTGMQLEYVKLKTPPSYR